MCATHMFYSFYYYVNDTPLLILCCYTLYLAGNTSLLTFATHASFSTAFSRATLSFYLFYTIATGIAACVLLPSVYDTPLF